MRDDSTISFIHLSDTHFGKDTDLEIFGRNTYNLSRRIIESIISLPFTPDFIIHTGDVACDPYPECNLIALKAFEGIKSPVYYVAGNHDDAKLLSSLPMGARRPLGGLDSLWYEFDIGPYLGIVLDTFIPGSPATIGQGHIPLEQLEYLEGRLTTCDKQKLVFLHSPPISVNSSWLDENLILLNGQKLHQLLAANASKVRGVFSGHIHRGLQMLKDGILYATTASSAFQFTAWPIDDHLRIDNHQGPSFSIVTVSPSCLWIKTHTLSL